MLKIKEEFKNLIPALTREEYKQLEDNCIAEGIREKILTWQGYIIDGHNRYNIAMQWQLEYETESMYFENESDVKIWMINNQFGRRNLIPYQRSVLALELEEIFASKAKENLKTSTGGYNPQPCHNCDKPETIDTKKEIAKIASVSHNTIARVKAIQAKAPEEVKQKLATGEISINQAYTDIKKQEKKEAVLKEREELAEIGKEKAIDIDFRLGDFEEAFADVPDGSIDCIITDPPYPIEFIECWTKLSRFAKRVLKPNGFCIAYSGHIYLDQVIKRMADNLDFYWIFAMYQPGANAIVHPTNIMVSWKPILIFQNGKKKNDRIIRDYFLSDKSEKNGHEWQQSLSGVSYLIEMFTKPNDLILEPFAGSGTTIIAAKQMNRRIMAAEIDEKSYNITKALI